MSIDADERLEKYLERIGPTLWPRVFCCESSRSFYCPECCQILVPPEEWPSAIREKTLRLPFEIDILLDKKERKTSSTGIQLFSIFSAIHSSCSPSEGTTKRESNPQVRLYDLGRERVPPYEPEEAGTYVLFPDKGSVPITSVAGDIRKLVVLDIKWTRQNVKVDPGITSLPKVHLESPPAKSRFWRWHNCGEGMLSTIEAIYFAAMEVTAGLWTPEERERLIQMMWLFALQHAVIHHRSELESRPTPFSEEGKEIRREMRTRQTRNPPKKKSEPGQFYKDLLH